MRSLKAPSLSTNQRSNRDASRNKMNALSIIDVGVSSGTLDDFFRGIFNTLGLEFGGTYKVSELISTFEKKDIHITSVMGVQYPGNMSLAIKQFVDNETPFAKMVLKNALFGSDASEKESFDNILEYFDSEFTLNKARILPSFTEFNRSLSIKDKYVVVICGSSPDGSIVDVPVVAVEIS